MTNYTLAELAEERRKRMKRWQHDETGRICEMEQSPGSRWYEIPPAFTLADLQAMPNSDLNALAAELRGLQYLPRFGNAFDFVWMDGDKVYAQEIDFTTDRNQSGALLEWAMGRGAEFEINLTPESCIEFCDARRHWNGFDISCGLACAETIAFCAAMLAMAGRLV